MITDLIDPPSSPETILELKRQFEEQVSASAQSPKKVAERSWLYAEFERVKIIALAVPDDLKSNLRAAKVQANFGHNDEAVEILEELIK